MRRAENGAGHGAVGDRTRAAPGYAPPLSVSRRACLVGGGDERFRQVIYSLFVTADRFETVRAAFGRVIGTTGPQYTILVAAAERQGAGGISIGALADHLHVAPSHITAEVNKLVALGLVAKRPNPADRRGVLVRLTASGRAALERLGPFRRTVNDLLFDGVGHTEFQTLARLFDRFLVNTERALDHVARAERARNRKG